MVQSTLRVTQVLTVVRLTVVKVHTAEPYAERARHRGFGMSGVRAFMLRTIAPHDPPSAAPVQVQRPSYRHKQQRSQTRRHEAYRVVQSGGTLPEEFIP